MTRAYYFAIIRRCDGTLRDTVTIRGNTLGDSRRFAIKGYGHTDYALVRVASLEDLCLMRRSALNAGDLAREDEEEE